jgi:hypothetical protein
MLRPERSSDVYIDERDIHNSIGGYKGKEEIEHGTKRSNWDNDGIGAPTKHTRWSNQMGSSRSASECIVKSNLSWRNGFIVGNKIPGMSAKCIAECQNIPYTGFEDNSNTRWNLRKLGDFGPVYFKD